MKQIMTLCIVSIGRSPAPGIHLNSQEKSGHEESCAQPSSNADWLSVTLSICTPIVSKKAAEAPIPQASQLSQRDCLSVSHWQT